jgi:hypothetical protein
MKKTFLLVFFLASAIFAAQIGNGTSIKSLQAFSYEDPFENKASIANTTRLVLVSFDKETGETAAKFFSARPADLLAKNRAVYIADIHRMPAIITLLFARPKMQKYTFPLYLYKKGDAFEKIVPHREGKLTVIFFDEQQKITIIRYIDTSKELEALFVR